MLAVFVNYFFELIFWVIFLTIFLTWIPTIDWNKPFFRALYNFSELILAPFRRFIPPINGFDLSPVVALMAIKFIQGMLVRFLITLPL